MMPAWVTYTDREQISTKRRRRATTLRHCTTFLGLCARQARDDNRDQIQSY